ncbi:peroxiredoxin [Corallococcus sp. H22C18031201]|uniref:peroxiredoxin n=1 Tax=Citreicoccus inhibens TaxID=2849499 RepID=UPI000E725074|nr:peroxiredoxin [Citreicoccus inhibens]MBU8894714.1 peroxiredoxin [Citreicoccus inhibens]RJS25288.1 peroxiredoxin [Corallococcus sp. H22C18031201]
MARAKTLQEGEAIPDVTLLGPGEKPVRLKDLLGDKVLVVYFYPRDDSPGCTVQSCSFRDQYEDFAAAGAEVVGISSDSVASHEGFATKYRLPFKLLSDPDGQARAAFGIRSTLGLIPGRVTFIVDRSGIVRHAFDSQIRVGEHVRKALEVVRSLGAAKAPAAR